MVAILLGLLVGGVLGEECFGHFSKIVERARWQRVEPVRGHAFQVGRKCEAHDWIIAGVDHHLVPKVADMLYRITYSGVVVECWSGEFLWELVLLISLEREDS